MAFSIERASVQREKSKWNKNRDVQSCLILRGLLFPLKLISTKVLLWTIKNVHELIEKDTKNRVKRGLVLIIEENPHPNYEKGSSCKSGDDSSEDGLPEPVAAGHQLARGRASPKTSVAD